MRLLATALLLGAFAAPVAAQSIAVPSDAAPQDTGCLVQGLDPNGDGFLALRAGPGTNYAQIGSLRNGDAAYVAAPRRYGRWIYVDGGAINGREAQFRGWIYDAWCSFYP